MSLCKVYVQQLMVSVEHTLNMFLWEKDEKKRQEKRQAAFAAALNSRAGDKAEKQDNTGDAADSGLRAQVHGEHKRELALFREGKVIQVVQTRSGRTVRKAVSQSEPVQQQGKKRKLVQALCHLMRRLQQ
eukprot:gb/GEZN01015171.1/.p1 GENE.gb/GEZN01015171.1/~~gb/GEZN01015171.1/.p1  ORF type:complete len:130 (+),score=22.58 gb/GEZN01015171.1/:234-623(+)